VNEHSNGIAPSLLSQTVAKLDDWRLVRFVARLYRGCNIWTRRGRRNVLFQKNARLDAGIVQPPQITSRRHAAGFWRGDDGSYAPTSKTKEPSGTGNGNAEKDTLGGGSLADRHCGLRAGSFLTGSKLLPQATEDG
jgi:hypothetical protein